MSYIKFPTQIKPARITVSLTRVDERPTSPLTNIFQIVARGNPVWQWGYEFVDLTDFERDIVQSFLLKCKGSLNTFKAPDPGDYEIRGSLSDWIDVFSGYGSFSDPAGSGSIDVTSWFRHATQFHSHVTEEGIVRFEWRDRLATVNLRWQGIDSLGKVDSLEVGQPYVQRLKLFSDGKPFSTSLRIGSSDGIGYRQGSTTQVKSAGSVSFPFTPVNTSHHVAVVDWTVSDESRIGDAFEQTDYKFMRCALVANSENLFTRSNDFDHADWTVVNAIVASGYMDADPVTGIASGGWKLFGDTSVNTQHYLTQSIVKVNTHDIYTVAVYARRIEFDMNLRIHIIADGSLTGARIEARFNLGDGVSNNAILTQTGQSFIDKHWISITDVGSGIWRCSVSALVSSHNLIGIAVFPVTSNFARDYTNDGSAGIEIFGATINRHPNVGPYVPTVANTVVGDTKQTGSRLVVTGLDPEAIIKTGQRFEIINQFYNQSSGTFERSEFKRMTKEIRVHREGHAILEFEPSIRNAPTQDWYRANDDHIGGCMHNPVIFHKPEMKARLVAGTIQYTDKALKATDINFSIIEDLAE